MKDKVIYYKAKGIVKLPGRPSMSFDEYEKEFGHSPVVFYQTRPIPSSLYIDKLMLGKKKKMKDEKRTV